ncbi:MULTISPECIES: cysteine--tRNA ligase [unclassified Pseudofrankia]|uniref:cysteine--tRNA ligase n=1 Tax=unclassified Pseudofrankia TaxID=2994372 RepID=UPI0008D8EABF|nr:MULTISPECIES: cysteine--tRNA ligase [unclassified Pseudofrankia]MDT3446680.1 cysteine--tRNA ligase [Pseudofrankia sp. BMG5.37]OHV57550.1 cysteine--tRNA ligase [Pseudofrankia sp. BMG5.36]
MTTTSGAFPVPRLSGRGVPLVGTCRMYVCGVTPYDVTHLGHASTFVWADAAARVLRLTGVDVRVCRNVTDIDDVLTAAAARRGEPYDRFAAVTQFRFEQDMAALAVQPPHSEPRAHQFVTQVQRLASALVDIDAGYVRDGAVYFRGADVAQRAGLSRAEAIDLATEYGDHPDDPAKLDPLDVAVWQPSDPGDPAWDSPWGTGRPGWHAECAAMALSTHGPGLDLHAGGADLRFPHHAYEAAIAEAVTGVRPFARAWMHVGLVSHEGRKMAKSTGNLVLVRDLLERRPPAHIRTMLLDRPYNTPWEYTPAALDEAATRLDALHLAGGRTGPATARAAALAALLDDLNISRAVDIAIEDGGEAAQLVTSILDPAVG